MNCKLLEFINNGFVIRKQIVSENITPEQIHDKIVAIFGEKYQSLVTYKLRPTTRTI